jgi:hypothetical protein
MVSQQQIIALLTSAPAAMGAEINGSVGVMRQLGRAR